MANLLIHLLEVTYSSVMYYLNTEMELSQSRERVFSFFSDVHNLELITPRWLHFKVLTPGHIAIDEGTLIDYRLCPHPLAEHHHAVGSSVSFRRRAS